MSLSSIDNAYTELYKCSQDMAAIVDRHGPWEEHGPHGKLSVREGRNRITALAQLKTYPIGLSLYAMIKSYLLLDQNANYFDCNSCIDHIDELECIPHFADKFFLHVGTIFYPLEFDLLWRTDDRSVPKERIYVRMHRPIISKGSARIARNVVTAKASIMGYPHPGILTIPREDDIPAYEASYSYALLPELYPTHTFKNNRPVEAKLAKEVDTSIYHPVMISAMRYLDELRSNFQSPVVY